MSDAQLTLDMAAPTGELPPERRIAQAAHDETAAMISAVVGAIPMVGHRKGTARETLQRPVAYLYACRDRLDERERELAIAICSRVTGDDAEELRDVIAWLPRRDGQPLQRGTAWLRLNGERVGTWGAGRESMRVIRGTPERDDYAWEMNAAHRVGDEWRRHFGGRIGQLISLAPEMLGTLAGWLLVLRWTPALAHVLRWRREGRVLGEDMLARFDHACGMAGDEHFDASDHAEAYRLAQLDPATSMLARAVMAVPPRGDS